MIELLPYIEKLININDVEIVSDCFWCPSYFADSSSELIDKIEKSSILKRCNHLMNSFCLHLKKESCDQDLVKIGTHSICPMIRLLGKYCYRK